eukprot:SM000063S20008  [mRNA]  locus=s63:183978:191010:- [translate_table: standard]
MDVHGAFGSRWLDLIQRLARQAIDRRPGLPGAMPGFNAAGSLAQVFRMRLAVSLQRPLAHAVHTRAGRALAAASGSRRSASFPAASYSDLMLLTRGTMASSTLQAASVISGVPVRQAGASEFCGKQVRPSVAAIGPARTKRAVCVRAKVQDAEAPSRRAVLLAAAAAAALGNSSTAKADNPIGIGSAGVGGRSDSRSAGQATAQKAGAIFSGAGKLDKKDVKDSPTNNESGIAQKAGSGIRDLNNKGSGNSRNAVRRFSDVGDIAGDVKDTVSNSVGQGRGEGQGFLDNVAEGVKNAGSSSNNNQDYASNYGQGGQDQRESKGLFGLGGQNQSNGQNQSKGIFGQGGGKKSPEASSTNESAGFARRESDIGQSRGLFGQVKNKVSSDINNTKGQSGGLFGLGGQVKNKVSSDINSAKSAADSATQGRSGGLFGLGGQSGGDQGVKNKVSSDINTFKSQAKKATGGDSEGLLGNIKSGIQRLRWGAISTCCMLTRLLVGAMAGGFNAAGSLAQVFRMRLAVSLQRSLAHAVHTRAGRAMAAASGSRRSASFPAASYSDLMLLTRGY